VVVLNKIDLPHVAEKQAEIEAELKKVGFTIRGHKDSS
jgi:hypothetical protein